MSRSNNSLAYTLGSISNSSRSSMELENPNILELRKMLEEMNSFDFDIFKFDEICNKRGLFYLSYELFFNYNFFEIIDEGKFKNFLEEIRLGYPRTNSYHNDIHAADVLQTCLVLIERGSLDKVNLFFLNFKKINLSMIDLLSIFLSAICHDFKHPGYNNNYQINLRTDIAINYNGKKLFLYFRSICT